MKKLLALVTALAVCISLSACGEKTPFSLDLSFWRRPAASKTVQPFVRRGNMITTVGDGVDTGGMYIARCIEDLHIVPAEDVDIAVFDVPQLVYQLDFIKYYGEEVGGWMPKEKQELIYAIRFYDDFRYMAVFSDTECENMLSPVYYIEDSALVREYFIDSGLYITADRLAEVTAFMDETFTGKDRDYIRQYITDGIKDLFLDNIPQDIVFTPDYDRMYTFYREDELIMICGFMNFGEDVYSYIVNIDTDEKGSWTVQTMMFMLYEDNPQV